MTRHAFRVFTAAAALMVCASTAAANSHSTFNTRETARQLKDLRSDKRALATKLNELAALARNHHLVSWQSKAVLLEEVRELVNRSARQVRQLEQQFESMPPAKRAAVETVKSELAAISPEVGRLMTELRENQLVSLQWDYSSRIIALSNRAIEARKATDIVVQAALTAQPGTMPSDD